MKKIISLIFLFFSLFFINSANATGGGINSINGFSQTSTGKSLGFSDAVYSSRVSIGTGETALGVISSTRDFLTFKNGIVYFYKEGDSTSYQNKTIIKNNENLGDISFYYSRAKNGFIIVGKTMSSDLYDFGLGDGGFTANNGDIVVINCNDDGTVTDYNYIQRTDTSTTKIQSFIHNQIDGDGVGNIYIGGTINSKGIYISIENSTLDISKIAQFNTISIIEGVIPTTISQNVLILGKPTTPTTRSVWNWDMGTNTLGTAIDITSSFSLNQDIKDFVKIGNYGYAIGLSSQENSTVLKQFNISSANSFSMSDNNIPSSTPGNIIDTKTGESFFYISVNSTDLNSTLGETGLINGNHGLILEYNYDNSGDLTRTVERFVTTNLVDLYTGLDIGVFYGLSKEDSLLYKFGDNSQNTSSCKNGTISFNYNVNTQTQEVTGIGDSTALKNYLSQNYTNTSEGDIDNAGEVTRTEGDFNGITSSPSYIFNYGFSNITGVFEQGFSYNSTESGSTRDYSFGSFPRGPITKDEIKRVFKDHNNSSDQNTLKNILQKNLIANATLSNTLGSNLGSYGFFYQNKGVDSSILDGSNPFYEVDYYSPIFSERKDINPTGIFSKYYVSARGVNNTYWYKDLNSSNASQGNSVLPNDIVWSPLNRPGIYKSDADYPQITFPIKNKSTGTVERYIEYSCGNLICKDYTKECIAPTVSKTEVLNCGNGILDKGEECEKNGNIIPTDIKTQFPLFDYSCSDTCKLISTPKANVLSLTGSKVITITGCKPDQKDIYSGTFCGNGVVDPGEECDFGTGTFGTCDQYCKKINPDNNIYCSKTNPKGIVNQAMGQSCSPDVNNPLYSPNCSDGSDGKQACMPNIVSSCGDGIVDKFTTDRVSEQCDFGADNGTSVVRGGIQCSSSCQESRPSSNPVCGDGIVQDGTNGTDNNNEQCELKADGSIVWGSVMQGKFDDGTLKPSDWGCTGKDRVVQCKVFKKLSCGDSKLDLGEECDIGTGTNLVNNCFPENAISITGTGAEEKDMSCKLAGCGDGYKETFLGEKCDYNDTSKDGWGENGCSTSCQPLNNPVTCSEDQGFKKSYNFLTFDSSNFDGNYELWTWNGGKMTKQKIRFPDSSNVVTEANTFALKQIGGQTVSVSPVQDVKQYMTKNFVSNLLSNNLIVPNGRLFNIKNRYIETMGLQSIFFDLDKVTTGGYVKTSFDSLLGFYDSGIKMEVQGLKCSDNSTVKNQAVTNVIGIIDTSKKGIYLMKLWGDSLSQSTELWQNKNLGDGL